MQKIAILYICTGQYVVLWKEFYQSFEKFFLTTYTKDYYVFTDSASIDFEYDNKRIHHINQEALEWPYSTLMRFHMFNRYSEELANYDYIFFVNANGQAVKTIEPDSILPRVSKGEDIVVVKHPAYRNDKPYQFPYDRNFRCKACIPYGLGKVYVQGCLIGGTADAFIKMSILLSSQIDSDLEKNIIALWHDESYLNKYILKYNSYRLVGPEFAVPILGGELEPHIYLRPKNMYFNVNEIKSNGDVTKLSRLNQFINNYCYNFAKKIDIMQFDMKLMKKNKGRIYCILWGIKIFIKALINI